MDIAHPQSLQTDPKIQNVRGYWAGSEDKGISQQTVIQNIFSKFLSKTTEIQKIHFAEETSFNTSFLSDSGMIIVYPCQQLADDLVGTQLTEISPSCYMVYRRGIFLSPKHKTDVFNHTMIYYIILRELIV